MVRVACHFLVPGYGCIKADRVESIFEVDSGPGRMKEPRTILFEGEGRHRDQSAEQARVCISPKSFPPLKLDEDFLCGE